MYTYHVSSSKKDIYRRGEHSTDVSMHDHETQMEKKCGVLCVEATVLLNLLDILNRHYQSLNIKLHTSTSAEIPCLVALGSSQAWCTTIIYVMAYLVSRKF